MSISRSLPLTLTVLVTLAAFAWSAALAGAPPVRAGLDNEAFDALSSSCLACHDGVQAAFVSGRQAGTPTRYAGHRSLDHPLGMRYSDYPARDPASYRYLLELDPSIRLIDGKVACVSCHVLKQEYARGARPVLALLDNERQECLASEELASDTRTNSLCLACHVM